MQPGLLENATREIIQLRNENTILRAKVEVLDIFKAALFGIPLRTGQDLDILHYLRKEIDAQQQQAPTPPPQADTPVSE